MTLLTRPANADFRRLMCLWGAMCTGILITGTPAMAQFSGNFGASLAVSRQDVLVGQPNNEYAPGVVYVYRSDAQGIWREAGRLTASDAALNDGFGRSVAASDSVLAISAVRKIARDSTPGAVYVFERTGGGDIGWKQTARIAPLGLRPGDRFGASVTVAGSRVYVGASGRDSVGAVFVFKRLDDAWVQEAVIYPDDVTQRAGFGAGVSVDGNYLLVGATDIDSGTGSAFVFHRDSSGAWTQEARLTVMPPFAAPQQGIGETILMRGTEAFVSAWKASTPAAVLIYQRDSASGRWVSRGQLFPFDGSHGFGSSIAWADGELWIGVPGAGGKGRLYRYTRDTAGVWSGVFQISPEFGGDLDDEYPAFGFPVAVSGSVAAVGIPAADFNEGRVALLRKDGRGEWRMQIVMGEIFRPKAVTGRSIQCVGGKAGMFDCEHVDLLSLIPVSDLGGARGAKLNDLWGWTDPETGREYALVGRTDGTAFVDLTDPERPRLVGQLPKTTTSPPSTWRDIKVYQNHAFIVADGAGAHGMQVFDLTRLRQATGKPVTFVPDVRYDRIHSAHNIVADTVSGFMYAVGGNSGGESCGSGLHMIDVRNPKRPVFAGCFTDTTGKAGQGGYTHDAQCVVYHGPDALYTGRQICLGSNGDALSIADVTDKASPKRIARSSYPNVGFAHQGWLDDEHRYFYLNDEYDESNGKIEGTRTIIWDLARLDDPVVAGEYIAKLKATDHNLYVKGNLVYESNYSSGLRVLDITERTRPNEVAFFDCMPIREDTPAFEGAWSNYPFFPSGTVAFTCIREGLFIVRVNASPTARD